jgi:hypothetical protein
MMTKVDVDCWMKTFGTEERTRLWRCDERGAVFVWVNYFQEYRFAIAYNRDRIFYGSEGI